MIRASLIKTARVVVPNGVRTAPHLKTVYNSFSEEVNLPSVGSMASNKKSKELACIANLCTKDVVKKTVQFADGDWFAGLSADSITNLTVKNISMVSRLTDQGESIPCSVTTLVLPPSMSWPTFQDKKQKNAEGKNIVIEKSSPLHVEGYLSAAAFLLKGQNVALVGHPGVGKSTELNLILMDLFRTLAVGKIDVVFHRAGKHLYRYERSKAGVSCEVVPGAGDSLDTLEKHFQVAGYEDMPRHNPSAVLVLELDEEERNPSWGMPTLLALSSRDVLEELKSFRKMDGLKIIQRPTHTREELLVLAKALFQSPSKPQFLSNLGLLSDSSVGDVLAAVEQRMEIIGPLAREVLGSQEIFTLWKNAMEKASGVSDFLDMKESASEFQLPKPAKYFLAPDAHGQLRFLSSHAIELVLKSAKNQHRERVAELGYAWQAAEYIVKKYCILNGAKNGTAVCDAWNYNEWEYFKNPPLVYKTLLRKHALDDKSKADLIAKITGRTHETFFDSTLLHTNIANLKGTDVYSSTKHTMSVGEFFVVVGNEVIFFQTSTIDPSRHTILLEQLKKIERAMKPDKITVIFFTDWCEKVTGRVTVMDKKENGEALSDSEVIKQVFGAREGKFEAFIIRCGIYTSIPRVIVTDDSSIPRVIVTNDATTLSELMTTFNEEGKVSSFYSIVQD